MANILPYLFTKDLRRLRLLLCVWFVIIGIKTYLYTAGAYTFYNNFEYQMFQPFLFQLFRFLDTFLIVVLIPMIIQDEPLVGTTAFWFTRPLSRQQVLSTKFLMVSILLVLVPLLVEITVLAVNHVPLTFVLLAVPEIIIDSLAFIMPFFLLASLTSRFSRYALGGIIVFAACIVWFILIMVLAIAFPGFTGFVERHFYSHNYQMMFSETMRQTSELVQHLLTILLFGALVVHQYLTRYTARTIRWTVVSVVLIFFFGNIWHTDLLKKEQPGQEKIQIIPKNLKANFDLRHVEVADGISYYARESTSKIIRSRLVITGIPENTFVKVISSSTVQMRYPDGKRLDIGNFNAPEYLTFSDEALEAPLQAALGNAVIRNPIASGKFQYSEIGRMNNEKFEEYKNKPGTYAVDTRLNIYKFKISSVLPLRPGQKAFAGNKEIEIFDILKEDRGYSVVLVEREVNLLFDRKNEKPSIFNLTSNGDSLEMYLLRNPIRNEVILPQTKEGDKEFSETSVQDTFNKGLRLKIYARQYSYNIAQAGVGKDWLKDAQLVRVGIRRVGSIPYDIRIKGFTIPEKTTDAKPEEHYSAVENMNNQQRNMIMERTK